MKEWRNYALNRLQLQDTKYQHSEPLQHGVSTRELQINQECYTKSNNPTKTGSKTEAPPLTMRNSPSSPLRKRTEANDKMEILLPTKSLQSQRSSNQNCICPNASPSRVYINEPDSMKVTQQCNIEPDINETNGERHEEIQKKTGNGTHKKRQKNTRLQEKKHKDKTAHTANRRCTQHDGTQKPFKWKEVTPSQKAPDQPERKQTERTKVKHGRADIQTTVQNTVTELQTQRTRSHTHTTNPSLLEAHITDTNTKETHINDNNTFEAHTNNNRTSGCTWDNRTNYEADDKQLSIKNCDRWNFRPIKNQQKSIDCWNFRPITNRQKSKFRPIEIEKNQNGHYFAPTRRQKIKRLPRAELGHTVNQVTVHTVTQPKSLSTRLFRKVQIMALHQNYTWPQDHLNFAATNNVRDQWTTHPEEARHCAYRTNAINSNYYGQIFDQYQGLISKTNINDNDERNPTASYHRNGDNLSKKAHHEREPSPDGIL
jgi:hypothetical protein